MNLVRRPRIMRALTFHSVLLSRGLCSNQFGYQKRNDLPGLDIISERRIQTIRFKRPEKRNALNLEMYNGIASLLREAAADDTVSATVLTGTGDFYSSGQEFEYNDSRLDFTNAMDNVLDYFQEFVAALIDHPKLIVAVVNGPAVGAAVTILGLCDVVYASDKAWFRVPFARLGLAPEGCASYTFPRILGPLQAARLFLLCETMSAEEAQKWGLVSQVFSGDRLEEEASSRVTEYTKLPYEATRNIKQLVRGWDRETLHRVNREEVQLLKKLFRTEGFHNAMATFFNKKKK